MAITLLPTPTSPADNPFGIDAATLEQVAASREYKPTRTVLVLGASYAGHRAIQLLVKKLPPGWRVVVLERNSHANHLYAFPRVSVVPSHENKVFIPYTNIFNPVDGGVPEHAADAGHALVHGCLTKLDLFPSGKASGQPPYGRGVATYRPLTEGSACCKDPRDGAADEDMHIRFDYLVYGLGSHLPPPINVWSTPSGKRSVVPQPTTNASGTACCMSSLSDKVDQSLSINGSKGASCSPPPAPVAMPCRGSKKEGTSWLREAQNRVRNAKSIVVIGGGALGVQFASDIASFYGTEKYTSTHAPSHAGAVDVGHKKVTLLASRRLLPRFNDWMHENAMAAMEDLGVEVLLNARADLSGDALSLEANDGKERIVRTLDGRQVRGELVLFCTGQQPCTSYLADALPPALQHAVDPHSRMAKVNRFLQLALPVRVPVVSDDADADADAAPTPSPDLDPQTVPSLQHIFAIGDAADAFGALNAGHTAWDQAMVAANNIVALIAASTEGHATLESYTPPPASIKVSVGLGHSIIQRHDANLKKEGPLDCPLDLNAGSMWTRRGLKDGGERGDYRE